MFVKTGDDRIGMPRTLREMLADGWTGHATYDRLYRAVMSGLIPAEPAENGSNRLEIRRRDFPVVGSVLGMKPPASHASASPARGGVPHAVAERANA